MVVCLLLDTLGVFFPKSLHSPRDAVCTRQDQDLTKKFNIAPGDLPDGLGNFPKVSHDPSRWWSNLSVGEGYFFDDGGSSFQRTAIVIFSMMLAAPSSGNCTWYSFSSFDYGGSSFLRTAILLAPPRPSPSGHASDGNWIEDYAGQADDMRRRTPTVDLKLPPWEHTYDSESQDERLFWGLDEPVALAG